MTRLAIVLLASLGVASAQTKPISLDEGESLIEAVTAGTVPSRISAMHRWAEFGHRYDDDKLGQLEEEHFDDPEEAMKESRAWHGRLIDALVANLKDSENLRREAVRTLAALCYGMKKSYGSCGNGREYLLEFDATYALLKQANELKPILIGLISDSNPDIVNTAISNLLDDAWRFGGSRFDAFRHSRDARFRFVAIRLAQKAPKKVQFDLIRPFLDDPDEDISDYARLALDIDPTLAIVIASNQSERSVGLRTLATASIDAQTAQGNATLLKLLRDPEPKLRAAAIAKLVNDDRHPFRDLAVLKNLLNDPSDEVKGYAFDGAIRSKMPGLKDFVRRFLSSSDANLREEALWATSHIDDPESLSLEMIHAVELGVESNWMASPGFDDPRFPGLIEKCMASKSGDVRQLVAFYASTSEEITRPDLILRLAKDPDPDVSRLVLADLHKIGSPEEMEILLGLCGTKNEKLKDQVIDALGRSGDPRAKAPLEKFAKDPSLEIRLRAKVTLKSLNPTLPPRRP